MTSSRHVYMTSHRTDLTTPQLRLFAASCDTEAETASAAIWIAFLEVERVGFTLRTPGALHVTLYTIINTHVPSACVLLSLLPTSTLLCTQSSTHLLVYCSAYFLPPRYSVHNHQHVCLCTAQPTSYLHVTLYTIINTHMSRLLVYCSAYFLPPR